MLGEHRYWFPAKRYGWGWGIPTCWQGWAVLIAYFLLIGLAIIVFRPDRTPVAFLASTGFLSLVLVGICWLKGEPPKWRWG